MNLSSIFLAVPRLRSYELFWMPKEQMRPGWLDVRSIDDLETGLGQTLVAVMVVNILEKSMTMTFSQPLHLLFAAVAALFSAGALNLVHQAAASGHGEGDHWVAAAKPQAGEAAA